jgi:hypothetical protein
MTSARYEIVVRGRLSARLEHLLEGFEVRDVEHGETHLIGWAQDQAALQGALRQISDFGLELVSVNACGRE